MPSYKENKNGPSIIVIELTSVTEIAKQNSLLFQLFGNIQRNIKNTYIVAFFMTDFANFAFDASPRIRIDNVIEFAEGQAASMS